MKTAIAIGGRAATMLLHALCVFLCTPLFDCKMRTLFVVPPLLGKNPIRTLFWDELEMSSGYVFIHPGSR